MLEVYERNYCYQCDYYLEDREGWHCKFNEEYEQYCTNELEEMGQRHESSNM